MALSIDVRHASEEDAGALVALLAQLHPRYPGDTGQARQRLREICGAPGRTLLVAVLDGTVVGTIDLLLVPNITHGGRPWAIVENLVVDEAVRGRGVGNALVSETVHRAEEAGAYMVQLLSLSHRVDAHAFYRRLGFEDVAIGFRRYLHGFAPTTGNDWPSGASGMRLVE